MVRVADYIAEMMVEAGISQVFMVTGGGAMHLNDALTRHPGLNALCMHHEQSCSMAAEGYARISGKMAIVNVTTGPGGINALNGVFGAFTDSVPMLVISGQVKRETINRNDPADLRQLGDQEVDIVAMASPITKFATLCQETTDVRYLVEKAIQVARMGRPGPTWVDVPIDIQGALIDPAALRGYQGDLDGVRGEDHASQGLTNLTRDVDTMVSRLSQARRPVILVGNGVHISRSESAFLNVLDRLRIPVVTAFNAHDLVNDDNVYFVGRQGSIGDRAGNYAVQNADFLINIGCRLNIRQISYNWPSFARAAYKVMVDIDRGEMTKATLNIDLPIKADLTSFLQILANATKNYKPPACHSDFLAWCKEKRREYPVVLKRYFTNKALVNPYAFADILFDELEQSDIIVTANATACIVTFQCAKIKQGQRLFSNSGSASMGYDLPAAIGACVASGAKRVVCIAGDGSIMMNIQELQTIAGHCLPIKIFVLNNQGYHSIKQTQQAFFPDNVYGCGPDTGLSFPDFINVASAFGLPANSCSNVDQLRTAVRSCLDSRGPSLCAIALDPSQPFSPKLSSRRLDDGRMVSSPLEDMAPFLPRSEHKKNMLIETSCDED